METKHWFASKTLIVNFIAIVAIIANSIWGFDIDAESQTAIATGVLAIVNIVLRLVTKQPVGK